MSEKEIYKMIDVIKSMILNKENKEDMLKAINLIHKEIMKLPIYKDFRNLVMLYEKEYGEYLFANVSVGGNNE